MTFTITRRLARGSSRVAPSFGDKVSWSGTPTTIGIPLISWAETSAPTTQGSSSTSYLSITDSNNNKILYSVSANIGRIEQRLINNRLIRGWLVEGEITNDHPLSRTVSDWTEKVNLNSSSTSVVLPDGTTSSTSVLAETVSNGEHYISQHHNSYTIIGMRYRWSFFVRSMNRSMCYITLNDVNGFGIKRAWFNIATGTFGTVQNGLTTEVVKYDNNWFLVTVSAIATSNNGQLNTYIGPATTDGAISYNTSVAQDSIAVSLFQLSTGDYTSLPVDTNGTPVTKLPDSLIYPSVNNVGVEEGAVLFGFHSSINTFENLRTLISIDDTTANNYIECYLDTYGFLNLSICKDSIVNSNCQLPYNKLDGLYHITLIAWRSNNCDLWCDGSLASDVFIIPPATHSVVRFGTNSLGAQSMAPVIIYDPMCFSHYITWNEALSASGFLRS